MKLKEKDLDAWYEENRELQEMDDYARIRNWNWGDGGYDEKLKIYKIFNPDSENKDKDVMDYKPKLGKHSLEWAMYNKFHGTSEWPIARENMIKVTKYDKTRNIAG